MSPEKTASLGVIVKPKEATPGALLTLSELAFELDMRPSNVGDLMHRWALPRPSERKNGELAWRWTDIEAAIKSCPTEFPIGEIYVIGFGIYVKIGYATAPAIRISALQVGAPEKLVVYGILPGTRIDERRLHRRFNATHTRGEWFRKEGELLAWIEAGCPPHDGMRADPVRIANV